MGIKELTFPQRQQLSPKEFLDDYLRQEPQMTDEMREIERTIEALTDKMDPTFRVLFYIETLEMMRNEEERQEGELNRQKKIGR